ncbi:MAG: AAA family ATPase, partial [Acidimicrobiia bacterium]|nr:AAA family ATPase [Acidimicrobiia bacterium]
MAHLLASPGGWAVPPLPADTVARERVLDHLAAHPEAHCVLAAAPAGYGKSTTLAGLAARDSRPSAWLALGPADRDPTALIARILLALDALEPLDDHAFKSLLLSAADLTTVRLPRFAALLERRHPCILVLDDAHVLDTDATREILRALVEHIADGSLVAIATRDPRPLGLARARARGRVIDIGVADLT